MIIHFLGIVKCIPGVSSTKDNPIIQTLDKLKDVTSSLGSSKSNITNGQEMSELLDKLYGLCSVDGSDNATIATRNGGVELLTRICSSLNVKIEGLLVSALKALSSILVGMPLVFEFWLMFMFY